ncbi:MAG: hypothetical protein ACXAC5_09890 [Promethearchaeota archaeon]|jgi:hypothetical protein
MNDKEKLDIATKLEKHFELNLPEFYKELNKAINANNRESIYQLSKIFTKYQLLKNLNN